MKDKNDIRILTEQEIKEFCVKHDLPKFRAKQIIRWLWKKRAISFNEMSSLSVSIRNLLSEHFCINPVTIHNFEKSTDGTIKYSLKLYDNLFVEGVLIPSGKRITACISSQVGCSLDCTFCATGTLKLERNLSAAEIYDQVFLLNDEALSNFGSHLSNIVFMGMGEPLLNYSSLLDSINLITTHKGLGMSPKRITVSTAGISKMIKKLADDNAQFHLAVSLHTTSNNTRNILMPINKKIDLDQLKESILYYYKKTKKRLTYEYVLFKNLNDDISDAKKLVDFVSVSPCKINLIEYNNVDGLPYEKSSNQATIKFIQYLEKQNIIVNLRKSKGDDIAAACGQLVNKLK